MLNIFFQDVYIYIYITGYNSARGVMFAPRKSNRDLDRIEWLPCRENTFITEQHNASIALSRGLALAVEDAPSSVHVMHPFQSRPENLEAWCKNFSRPL